MTALALIHKQSIVERIAQGEYMKDIAASLNVSPAAISQVLAKDPDYSAARECGIKVKLEKYQGDIDTAPDALNLARAREAFRAQSWIAERECPSRWGNKQEITHINHDTDIKSLLDEREARLNAIDSTCKLVTGGEG